jgi:hypothetical protein
MGLEKRYGYCICHNTMSSLNAKGLCPIGAKERHEKSAESKGLTIKKKGNDINRSIENYIRESSSNRLLEETTKTTPTNKEKAKIKYRSDKGKELAKQELLLFQKLFQERSSSCEYCGTEITVFNPTNYHHVRTKGSHPELRLVESNIVKICVECHLKEHGFKPRKNGNKN